MAGRERQRETERETEKERDKEKERVRERERDIEGCREISGEKHNQETLKRNKSSRNLEIPSQ